MFLIDVPILQVEFLVGRREPLEVELCSEWVG